MIYKGPANRLLREGDWQTKQLVEELYAIFQTDELVAQGQLILNQKDPDAPPLIINQPPYSTSPAIVVNRRTPDGEAHQITIGTTPNGDVSIQIDGDEISEGGGGGGFPGVVQSGTGSSYQVLITTATGTQVVTVTQIQIAPGETIPSGTGCTVVKVGTAYFMQVPVWQ